MEVGRFLGDFGGERGNYAKDECVLCSVGLKNLCTKDAIRTGCHYKTAVSMDAFCTIP